MAKEKLQPESNTPATSGLTEETVDGVVFVTLTHNIDGEPFLPDAQPKAVKELWEAGVKYETVKTERIKLGKQEGELKTELKGLYNKYPQFFRASDNDPKIKIYSIGGLTVDAELKESVEIKTHKDAPPPISAAAQDSKDTVDALKGNKRDKTPADVY